MTTPNESEWPTARCPACSRTLGVLAKFCNFCGTKMPTSGEPIDLAEQTGTMLVVCSEIGHRRQVELNGSLFCIMCGTALARLN